MRNGIQLTLDRCPHCRITNPNLVRLVNYDTSSFDGITKRDWYLYRCVSCGGVVLTEAKVGNSEITNTWPQPVTISDTVPTRAREYLKQANDSLHSPAGAVMLTGSAVDAMLKDKGYKDGSLYKRIEAAANDHLITAEMAAWAHEVRLDANDQRHADDEAPLPSEPDAVKVIEFANALAQFLYVLPAQVARGRDLKPLKAGTKK
jgi:hypothetical protein